MVSTMIAKDEPHKRELTEKMNRIDDGLWYLPHDDPQFLKELKESVHAEQEAQRDAIGEW